MSNFAIRLLASSAFASIMAFPPAAWAGESVWDHNGSLMKLTAQGDAVRIVYLNPKGSIRDQGVTRGTIFFDGTLRDGHDLTGNARRFRGGCEPAAFAVEGTFSPLAGQERLVLEGRAPTRQSVGCDFTPASEQSQIAQLIFRRVGMDGHLDGEGGDDEMVAVFDEADPEPAQSQAAGTPGDAGSEAPAESKAANAAEAARGEPAAESEAANVPADARSETAAEPEPVSTPADALGEPPAEPEAGSTERDVSAPSMGGTQANSLQ